MVVYTTPVAENAAPISTDVPKLVAALRQQYASAGTGLAVTSSSVKVGQSTPAVRASVSYSGIWLQGSGERGTIKHTIYFFIQHGVLYQFDYSGVTPWVTKDLPVFAASAKSIHFVRTA